MLPTTRFRIETPPVIHETLDGEVIVVNLDTGVYYSLTGVAAEIWAAVEAGASTAQAAAELHVRYDAPRDDIDGAVAHFVHELEREQLISGDGDAGVHAPAAVNGTPRPKFVEPQLRKYTDMKELLLLDPIHEVGEAGWPNSAADDAASA
jgi:Coenzyme PQQ synthesis protein D (PqqD)